METTYDVKNIFDIPNFEDYANEKFEFQAYDKGDNTLMYEFFDQDRNTRITIDFIVEEFSSIFRFETLLELSTMQGIGCFNMCWWSKDYGDDEEDEYKVKSYHYRPFVNESDKNYA